MHDGVFFEDHGIPTATVISTEFQRAARAQASALGADDYETVMVQHPIQPLTRDEVRDLVPGVDGGEGLPAHVLAKFPDPRSEATLIAKFREPANLKFLVAGGTAGRFSAVVAGWTFPKMSRMVTRRIDAE